MTMTKEIPQVRKKANFEFLADLFQGNRTKPQKFKHSLKMPFSLYLELAEAKVMDHEDLFCNEIAFFTFSSELIMNDYCESSEFVTISFISLFNIEDLHRKIDHYLIVKYSGFYPIQRFGTFF